MNNSLPPFSLILPLPRHLLWGTPRCWVWGLLSGTALGGSQLLLSIVWKSITDKWPEVRGNHHNVYNGPPDFWTNCDSDCVLNCETPDLG